MITPKVRAYPRVCGGANSDDGVCWNTLGLSPRVRGSPDELYATPLIAGPIPACAGEP